MSEQQIVYVKGPMHPDLFDGQTPMIQPVEIEQALKVYSVTVVAHKTARMEVVAQNEDQAAERAEQAIEDDVDMDFEVEADDAREMAGYAPEPEDIEKWVQWNKRYKGLLP